jgi:valyl-tRNA synthetase
MLTINGAGSRSILTLKGILDVLARVEVKSGKSAGKPDGHEAGVNFWLQLPRASHQHVEREVASLQQYIQSLERKLANENFTKNAPAAVVEGERKKLTEAKVKLQQLTN